MFVNNVLLHCNPPPMSESKLSEGRCRLVLEDRGIHRITFFNDRIIPQHSFGTASSTFWWVLVWATSWRIWNRFRNTCLLPTNVPTSDERTNDSHGRLFTECHHRVHQKFTCYKDDNLSNSPYDHVQRDPGSMGSALWLFLTLKRSSSRFTSTYHLQTMHKKVHSQKYSSIKNSRICFPQNKQIMVHSGYSDHVPKGSTIV